MKTQMTYEEAYKQFYPLMIKMVNSTKQPNELKADLIQMGRIGIFNGISTHTETKGPLLPWIKIHIKKEILTFINQHSRTVRLPVNVIKDKERERFPVENLVSLDVSLYDDGEALSSTIAYDDTPYMEKDLSSLKEAINELKPRWKQIMEMRLTGSTLDEIAEVLDITRQGVSDQMNKAMKKMKEYLNVDTERHDYKLSYKKKSPKQDPLVFK